MLNSMIWTMLKFAELTVLTWQLPLTILKVVANDNFFWASCIES